MRPNKIVIITSQSPKVTPSNGLICPNYSPNSLEVYSFENRSPKTELTLNIYKFDLWKFSAFNHKESLYLSIFFPTDIKIQLDGPLLGPVNLWRASNSALCLVESLFEVILLCLFHVFVSSTEKSLHGCANTRRTPFWWALNKHGSRSHNLSCMNPPRQIALQCFTTHHIGALRHM